MNLTDLTPEARLVFLSLIRQYARDLGLSKRVGTERAEELLLEGVEKGYIRLEYDRKTQFVTLVVL